MATCRVCNGKQICSSCHGRGKRGGVITSSCDSCRGKGHCVACDGKGWRN